MNNDSPIIVALDFPNAKKANKFINQIKDQPCKLKVGQELFIAEGPRFVENLVASGHQVFLDLKLHDIPNTVASACKSLSCLGVWMTTLHASGGLEMMRVAQEVNSTNEHAIKLVAVTVLTSLAQEHLSEIGFTQSADLHVLQLTKLAMDAKMDGVVCSVHEAGDIRDRWGNQPIIVTPGIRLNDKDIGDQSRVATPGQAKKSGSSYIVLGRPITQSNDPVSAIKKIRESWDEEIF